jgi:hypothetical protein
MSKFRDIDNTELFKHLLSEEETVPEGHTARFVVEVVSQLDLSTVSG